MGNVVKKFLILFAQSEASVSYSPGAESHPYRLGCHLFSVNVWVLRWCQSSAI